MGLSTVSQVHQVSSARQLRRTCKNTQNKTLSALWLSLYSRSPNTMTHSVSQAMMGRTAAPGHQNHHSLGYTSLVVRASFGPHLDA